MKLQQHHWLKREIPNYVSRFSDFPSFEKALKSACASYWWRVAATAYALAFFQEKTHE